MIIHQFNVWIFRGGVAARNWHHGNDSDRGAEVIASRQSCRWCLWRCMMGGEDSVAEQFVQARLHRFSPVRGMFPGVNKGFVRALGGDVAQNSYLIRMRIVDPGCVTWCILRVNPS